MRTRAFYVTLFFPFSFLKKKRTCFVHNSYFPIAWNILYYHMPTFVLILIRGCIALIAEDYVINIQICLSLPFNCLVHILFQTVDTFIIFTFVNLTFLSYQKRKGQNRSFLTKVLERRSPLFLYKTCRG